MRHIAIFLLVFSLFACNEGGEIPSSVLLRVNGRITTLDQFQDEFSRLQATEHKFSEEERRDLERSFLAQKIEREIILSEADRAGIQIPNSQLEAIMAGNLAEYPEGAFEDMLREQHLTLDEWKKQMEDNMRIEYTAKALAYAEIRTSEEEIATYYQENRERFHRAEQVRARQIVLKNEKEGRKVLGLLLQGAPFEEIAKKYSRSPDAEQGGDLGFFGRGEMPLEFDQAVFALPVGRLSELVKSEYGYHIFLVDERRPSSRLTLDDVRDEIRAILQETKEEEAYQQWLQTLRSRAAIEVDWTLL